MARDVCQKKFRSRIEIFERRNGRKNDWRYFVGIGNLEEFRRMDRFEKEVCKNFVRENNVANCCGCGDGTLRFINEDGFYSCARDNVPMLVRGLKDEIRGRSFRTTLTSNNTHRSLK